MQVVDEEHDRTGGGFVDGQRDELLGQQRRNVGAAVGGNLAPEQPGDRGPPGVSRWRPDPERVQEWVQREFLAELVAGPAKDLAADRRPGVVRIGARAGPGGGGREGGADQGGLADPRFALDEHGVATASGEIS